MWQGRRRHRRTTVVQKPKAKGENKKRFAKTTAERAGNRFQVLKEKPPGKIKPKEKRLDHNPRGAWEKNHGKPPRKNQGGRLGNNGENGNR